MSIKIDEDDVKEVSDDDLIEWVLFEFDKRRECRRLPGKLDRMDISFTHPPKFDRIIKIERK